jgi:hypothetical protein
MNCVKCRAPKLMRYTCTLICGGHLTKFIQVYLNGSGTENQSEAIDNVHYWYNGNVPYSTDATAQSTASAWQPRDSTCTSLSSIAWSDSVPSPTPYNQHHSHSDDAINLPPYLGPPSVCAAPSPTPHSHGRHHSDDAINESQLQLALRPYPPSIPQMTSTVYVQSQQQQRQEDQDQQPLEVPVSTTPLLGPSSPALDLTPPEDPFRRRAPKRWCITRTVQPLACYFCRGRKIACGLQTNPRSSDRTCECIISHLQLFLYKLCFVCLFIFSSVLKPGADELNINTFFCWYEADPVRDDGSSVSILQSPIMAADSDPLTKSSHICETSTALNNWMAHASTYLCVGSNSRYPRLEEEYIFFMIFLVALNSVACIVTVFAEAQMYQIVYFPYIASTLLVILLLSNRRLQLFL